MAKGWFRDLLIPMKPTESTPPTTMTSREWVISFREAFFIPLLRLYLIFFPLFCLDYFHPFDLLEVVSTGYFFYILLPVFDAMFPTTVPTLKKLVIYMKNRGEPLKRECMSESILSRDDAETMSLAFSPHISVHMGILLLLLSLPSPRHFITSFDPPLFVLDGLLFSYYCLIGLSLHLSVQILKKIMKPMLNTLATSLKNKGIISVSSKFESGKNREQKPLVDLACQSDLLVEGFLRESRARSAARSAEEKRKAHFLESLIGPLPRHNSDKTNAREASKGPCMMEGVRSLVDSTTRISSTDFDAPDKSAHLVRAIQSGPIMLNSEKNYTSEGLIGEYLTESVLSLDDSTKRKSFPDFDAAENKAHLVRPYQSGPVVSLSENKNEGEALKKDLQQHCGGRSDAAAKSFHAIYDPGLHATDSLTWKSFEVLETLRPREQQSNATDTDQERQIQTQMCDELSDARGGRPDAAAKSFHAIYDPGFHTPYSFTRKSFDVLETLPARKQPNDGVPLLLPGRLTLEGCVQQEKSPDLPRVMQFNGVEQRVTKMPRYLGGLTAQMIKHVLTSSKIKVNAKNKSGRTALDIHFNTGNPSDTEIQDILIEAGAKRREPASVVEVERLEPSWQTKRRNTRMIVGSLIAIAIMAFQVLVPTKRRNTRMIVGSLIAIATMAFQVLVPTGLVWLDNLKGPGGHVAGEAIIAYNSPHQYRGFMYLTTVGFLVSLSTIVMLIFALIFALKNKGIISVSSKFESGKNREQKPLVDFDSTNNRACQSGLLVSNSDKTTAREASKGPCMTEGALSLVDLTTRISSTDFHAPENGARLVKANQSGPITLNSEKKDTSEGLIGECLIESVLSLDDSTKRKSFPDFDAAENKAHLVRAYQSGPVVSLSENKNQGEALKRECITKSILGLEDLQQHCGGRPDAAAKSFRAIYDPGLHTTDSLTRKSFQVLETLRPREQQSNATDTDQERQIHTQMCHELSDARGAHPIHLDTYIRRFWTHLCQSLCHSVCIRSIFGEQSNDLVPLLSLRRLALKGCVRQDKSPCFPRLLQINAVEQKLTQSPRYSGGLIAQSACSSRWPIGLQDGANIVLLDPLKQSAKNVAYAVRQDQCSLTVSLREKKMVRRKLKRKYRTISVIFEYHQQHFGRRCEGAVKSFGAMRHCRKHGIRQVSTVKRIHKQHWIHRWPFRQKTATRNGYSLRDERPFGASKLSMDEKLDSWLLFIHMSQFARSSPQPLGLLDGCVIVGPIASSSSEFAATNNRAHFVRQDQSCSTASCREGKSAREMLDKQGITMSLCIVDDLQQHFGGKHKDAMKRLGVNISMFKSTCRLHQFYWQPCWNEKNEQVFDARNNRTPLAIADQSGPTMSNSKKENTREALKRECVTSRVLRHLVRQRTLTHKHCVRRKKSQDLPRSLQMDCSGGLASQKSTRSLHWPLGLPDGGPIITHSEKKILRNTFKRKCRSMSVGFEDHQQHFCSRCEGAANSLGAKRNCKRHGINLVSTAKRIHRQHGIHRCPFRQGYSLGGERPAEVISLSMDEKFVSRLQFLHMSWLARSSLHHFALRSGREIVGYIAFSSSEFAATNNRAHPGGQDRCGSSASRPENERTKETKNGEGTASRIISREVLEQHFGSKREDVAKILGYSVSTFKRVCRDHGIPRWPNRRSNYVRRPPDPHGEKNPSPTFNTLSTNGQITMEMGGQNSEPNECLPDSFEDPNFRNTGNGSIAEFEKTPTFHDSLPGRRDADIYFPAVYSDTSPHWGSSELMFQQKNQSTQFAAYPNPNGLVDPQPQMAPTQKISENMRSLEDRRNLLAPQKEPLPEGHVFGSVNWTIGSCSSLAPSQPMPTIPHTTGSSEYWRNSLAFVEGHLMGENLNGSFNLTVPPCSDPASQPMPTIHHTMATIPHLTPLLTERPDTRSVKLKAIYGDTTIKFQLPLTSGINELKEEVSKILECKLGSFNVEYKDEDGDWILMARDENLSEYLQLLTSLGNQVTKLQIRDKVPHTTNFCDNCGYDNCRSLKQKRP